MATMHAQTTYKPGKTVLHVPALVLHCHLCHPYCTLLVYAACNQPWPIVKLDPSATFGQLLSSGLAIAAVEYIFACLEVLHESHRYCGWYKGPTAS